MPELPEVEILARHLRPRIVGKTLRRIELMRAASIRGCSARRFVGAIRGQRIDRLSRRAKFLRFGLANGGSFLVHLGMTGRVFVAENPLRGKHDVARFHLDDAVIVFRDPRKFGRLALGDDSLARLGPEPLGPEFTAAWLGERLRRSSAPIKVRLLDQTLVAGMGNIYASEVVWRARIHPAMPCDRLDAAQVRSLREAIVLTLREAIRFGGGLSLGFDSSGSGDGLFYYGSGNRRRNPAEHFAVYDREGKPCRRCRTPIEKMRQGGRSTYFCPRCQAPG